MSLTSARNLRVTARAPLAGLVMFATIVLVNLPAMAGDPKPIPFKETLTLVKFESGIAYYVGKATHLGKVSVVEYFNPDFNAADPDSVFATYVKTAANGDTLFGRVIPDDPANPFTTGTITIDGGTGRFTGVTGITRYVISIDPDTGAVVAHIEGTISSVGSTK